MGWTLLIKLGRFRSCKLCSLNIKVNGQKRSWFWILTVYIYPSSRKTGCKEAKLTINTQRRIINYREEKRVEKCDNRNGIRVARWKFFLKDTRGADNWCELWPNLFTLVGPIFNNCNWTGLFKLSLLSFLTLFPIINRVTSHT